MFDEVVSIEDMNSLTMDILEEHLDDDQKEEAEREFEIEIAPLPPPSLQEEAPQPAEELEKIPARIS